MKSDNQNKISNDAELINDMRSANYLIIPGLAIEAPS